VVDVIFGTDIRVGARSRDKADTWYDMIQINGITDG
jgi:hypothetical protein